MSLWADIDDYLRTELTNELGSGGSYNTQVVKQVIVDDIMDEYRDTLRELAK